MPFNKGDFYNICQDRGKVRSSQNGCEVSRGTDGTKVRGSNPAHSDTWASLTKKAITSKRFWIERWETIRMKALEPLHLLVKVTSHSNMHEKIRKHWGSIHIPPRRLHGNTGKCLTQRNCTSGIEWEKREELYKDWLGCMECIVKERKWHHGP